MRGASLTQLIEIANDLDLTSRAVRVNLEKINHIKLPAVLHWNLDHYVVLTKVENKKYTIHNPAFGKEQLDEEEFSRSFTGIALECTPSNQFEAKDFPKLSIFKLLKLDNSNVADLCKIIFLAAFLEITMLAMPQGIKKIIDASINYSPSASIELIASVMMGLVIAQVVFLGSRQFIVNKLNTNMSLTLMSNLQSHLLRLPMSYFDSRQIGDVASRLNSLDVIQKTLSLHLVEILIDSIMSITSLIVLMYIQAQFAAFCFFCILSNFIFRYINGPKLLEFTEEYVARTAKQQSHFLETVRGIQAVKLFNKQGFRLSLWYNRATESFNALYKKNQLQNNITMFATFANGICITFIIYIGGTLIVTKQISVGMLFVCLTYAQLLCARSSSISDRLIELILLKVHKDRVADILLTDIEDNSLKSDFPVATGKNIGIEIKDLWFRYSEKDKFIISGLNLTIRPGESVAIVGETGCGKSTLAKLLCGILKPTKGQISLGNINFERLPLNNLRQLVGTVMQHDHLFLGSIRDNITFFNADCDEDFVLECCKAASIDRFVDSLPMKFDSTISEGATSISGGQKQRFLLARALYHKPKILILDEATSHLDIAIEEKVNLAIKKMNTTRIIIAHRQETIDSADRVYEFNNGALHERIKENAVSD
ncbi:ATP-binding cassette subfamily B protein RaxB [Paludibacterium purpuratum]|uniref:Cyclolysin secretion/processing ATP-binding protein CyaB n=2 Tax=Paludibacterium purpuratum TaxID=1144873 RepID=A0A4R7B865_9NEIS|nr:ATP-binding cassette subfamily B protein RaxB [Paludibacterium purpuratum]